VWFLLDLAINFFTTYENEELCVIVTDRTMIAKDYLTGWFIIDFASSIPVGVIVHNSLNGGQDHSDRQKSTAVAAVKMLKIVKLLRLFRFGRIIRKLQERFRLSYSVVMIGKFMVMLGFTAHWLGCFFWFIGTEAVDAGLSSWIQGNGENGTPYLQLPKSDSYIVCLYWALATMTTIGYGDVTPANHLEQLYCMVAMIVGACSFAYGLTNVCSLVFNRNKANVDFMALTDEVAEYMKRHEIPSSLSYRVRKYLWFRQMVATAEITQASTERVLAPLSGELRTEGERHSDYTVRAADRR
jgi:hypothetical protein